MHSPVACTGLAWPRQGFREMFCKVWARSTKKICTKFLRGKPTKFGLRSREMGKRKRRGAAGGRGAGAGGAGGRGPQASGVRGAVSKTQNAENSAMSNEIGLRPKRGRGSTDKGPQPAGRRPSASTKGHGASRPGRARVLGLALALLTQHQPHKQETREIFASATWQHTRDERSHARTRRARGRDPPRHEP